MSIKTMKFLANLLGEDLTFGLVLKATREAEEVSQARLAEMINVSRGLICDVEKGRRMPTIEQVGLLAKALRYSEKAFLSLYFESVLKKANYKYKVDLKTVS